jgi:hypothetical protein
MGAAKAATAAAYASTATAPPSGVCFIKRSSEKEGQCCTERKNSLYLQFHVAAPSGGLVIFGHSRILLPAKATLARAFMNAG